MSMDNIRVLDVTLRDGGIVNDFKFGEDNIKLIIKSLEESGLDFIEVGYLEKNTGTERGRSQYINEKVIRQYVLTSKKPGVTYSVMIDYGKFDVDTLENRQKDGIDAVRFAFHKRNFNDVETIYNKLIAKGYDVYMQPMVTMHYTEKELGELVDLANRLDIKGMYFVDTFGQMLQADVLRLAEFFDTRLRKDIALGFHSHNNVQMAFANSICFLQYYTQRPKMIDSSIMGMGRGAGNLNTELILQFLNQNTEKKYDNLPLLKVMDSVLNPIKATYPWGYSVEYYLSSANDCSPIYSSHYYKKHMLPVEQINELLKMVEGEMRISFKKDYAEEIYRKYNSRRPCDDTATIEKLKGIINGKKVCVIAPGQTLVSEKQKVEQAVRDADITISLNCSVFGSSMILITREEAFAKIPLTDSLYIVTSNVECAVDNRTFVVNYLNWISIIDGETRDSAGYVVINLLIGLGAKEIMLAGFDGFSANVDKNYYTDALKRSVTVDQLESRNEIFSNFIKGKSKELPISFVTTTMYNQAHNQ